MEEAMKNFLKEHLSIELWDETTYEGKRLRVKLKLDDEVISSDYVYTESLND